MSGLCDRCLHSAHLPDECLSEDGDECRCEHDGLSETAAERRERLECLAEDRRDDERRSLS